MNSGVDGKCVGKHTFESDVYMLPQPRVDAIRGGIFRDRVILKPTATGETIEVIAGVNGPIHFTQNRPRYEKTKKIQSK